MRERNKRVAAERPSEMEETARAALPCVEPGPAIVWTCLGCGTQNLEPLVPVEEPDVLAEMTARVLAAEGREALNPDERMDFMCSPTLTACGACSAHFRIDNTEREVPPLPEGEAP